jgi:hypothetical protein
METNTVERAETDTLARLPAKIALLRPSSRDRERMGDCIEKRKKKAAGGQKRKRGLK